MYFLAWAKKRLNPTHVRQRFTDDYYYLLFMMGFWWIKKTPWSTFRFSVKSVLENGQTDRLYSLPHIHNKNDEQNYQWFSTEHALTDSMCYNSYWSKNGKKTYTWRFHLINSKFSRQNKDETDNRVKPYERKQAILCWIRIGFQNCSPHRKQTSVTLNGLPSNRTYA